MIRFSQSNGQMMLALRKTSFIDKINFTVAFLSIFCNKVIVSKYSTDLIQLGISTCHYQVNFCTIKKQNDEDTPCCSRCSCWSSCYEKGECCPDIANTTFRFRHSCHSVYYKNTEYWRRHTQLPARSYEMVTACPDGTDCSFNPFQPGADVRLDDLVVVYTEPDKIIFQNRMCAECNGIYDYKRWRLIASDCMFREKIPEDMSGKKMTQHMLKNCVIYSFPELANEMLPQTCGKTYKETMISVCNVTGRWNTLDNSVIDNLFDACNDKYLHAPVIESTTFNIYKNVYCYLCNSKVGEQLATSCYQFVKDRFTNEFVEILDLHTDFSPLTATANEVCEENEIFDEFFGKCMAVICPGYQYFTGGICVNPPFELSIDVYYKFNIMLFPLKLIPSDTPLEAINLNDVFNSILDTSNMNNLCEYFQMISVKAYLHLESLTLHFFIFEINALAVAEKYTNCTHENLANSLQNFTNSVELNITVPFDAESVDTIMFSLQPDNRTQMLDSLERLDPINETHFSKLLFERQEGKIPTTIIEIPFVCPHLTLDVPEYTKLVSQYQTQEQNVADVTFADRYEIVVKTFVNSYVDYLDNRLLRTYSICLDQYKRLTSKPVVKPTTTALGTLSLVLSCISMICTLVIFLLFCFTKRLNNGPMVIFGCALVNLFVAQGFFQFGSGWNDKPSLCQIIGIAIHYFWLASVFALNAYCVLILRQIVSVRIKMCNTDLAVSLFYVYGLPACFVLVNIMYTNADTSTPAGSGYGAGQCHINTALMRGLLFAFPIFLTVAFNIVINCMIAVKIKRTQNTANSTRRESRYAIVFFRLLVVAGFTWIFGILKEFVNSPVLDYCFVIFVGGQGIFLLFSFVCRQHFIQQLRKEFQSRTSDRFLSGSTSNGSDVHVKSTIKENE